MSPALTVRQRFYAWMADNPDESVLRWIFRSVLAIAVVVLAVDLAGSSGWVAEPGPGEMPVEARPDLPGLPPSSLLPSILAPLLPGGDKRVMPMPRADGPLSEPMTFELVGGGKLIANGTITPGISQAFAAEVQKHGDYIRTVVLNSPGGAVADALAMGRLIRERKFATEVAAAKYCASSCPLVFAGGVERHAGKGATIGVHQIAALHSGGPPRDEMSAAQKISARCERYLGNMGIDLQVWVRAMETPHDRLFVFKPDELKSFRLVTAEAAPAPAAAPTIAAPTRSR